MTEPFEPNKGTTVAIPGVHTVDFCQSLTDRRIRHVMPRHEQGAAFMTYGYAFDRPAGTLHCTSDHTYDRAARPHRTAWAGLQYLLFKTGPVTSTLFATGGFWCADKHARSPDVQFHMGLGRESRRASSRELRHGHGARRRRDAGSQVTWPPRDPGCRGFGDAFRPVEQHECAYDCGR
jgi:choline dehydrogenase-like flavoprotein